MSSRPVSPVVCRVLTTSTGSEAGCSSTGTEVGELLHGMILLYQRIALSKPFSLTCCTPLTTDTPHSAISQSTNLLAHIISLARSPPPSFFFQPAHKTGPVLALTPLPS